MLGELERAEDPPAQLECVVDRLHPGGVVGELRVAEVRLGGARGDDQAVVRDLAAPAERLDGEAAGVEVDVHHLAEDDLRVLLAA